MLGWMKEKAPYVSTVLTLIIIVTMLSVFFADISEVTNSKMTEEEEEKLVTGEIPEIDKKNYSSTTSVDFATWCYWGTEANMGIIPGVISTQAGYAVPKDSDGSRMDAETELVRITYDPEVVSYEELLAAYKGGVDPTRIDISLIFSSASDSQQKHFFRENKTLFEAYKKVYPDEDELVNSTAVTRINGYLAGLGELNSTEDLAGLGLGERGKRLVYNNWASKNGVSCIVP